MKKNKLHLIVRALYIFLILVHSSCNQGIKENKDYNENIRDYFIKSEFQVLKLDYIDEINLSDILDPQSIKYIPLSNQNNTLIGNINLIKIEDNGIYIFDQRISKKLMYFDTLGNIKAEIAGKGKGPGELIYPTDFFVRPDGNIVIVDSPVSFVSYSPSGELIGNEKLPFFIEEMELFGSSEYLIYGPSGSYIPKLKGSEYNYVLYIISKDLKNISNCYFPFNEFDDSVSDNLISSYQDIFTFCRSFYQKFYSIDNKGLLRPRFYIDFGDFNAPEDLLYSLNQEKMEALFFDGKYASAMENVIETDTYFMFQFYIGRVDSDHVWLAIHDKNSGNTVATKNIINDVDGGLYEFPKNNKENKLISVIYPDLLKDHIKNNFIKTETNLKNMVDTLNYDDNPVIMLHQLKEDIDFDLLIKR